MFKNKRRILVDETKSQTLLAIFNIILIIML